MINKTTAQKVEVKLKMFDKYQVIKKYFRLIRDSKNSFHLYLLGENLTWKKTFYSAE